MIIYINAKDTDILKKQKSAYICPAIAPHGGQN